MLVSSERYIDYWWFFAENPEPVGTFPDTSDPPNHAGFRLATWIKKAHTGFEPATESEVIPSFSQETTAQGERIAAPLDSIRSNYAASTRNEGLQHGVS
jgi:hypothetical protein